MASVFAGTTRCVKVQNFLKISISDVTVPVPNPTSPSTIMPIFFTQVTLPGWNVTSSITAGMMRARKELARAPMREINRSRCGIAADRPPETYKLAAA